MVLFFIFLLMASNNFFDIFDTLFYNRNHYLIMPIDIMHTYFYNMYVPKLYPLLPLGENQIRTKTLQIIEGNCSNCFLMLRILSIMQTSKRFQTILIIQFVLVFSSIYLCKKLFYIQIACFLPNISANKSFAGNYIFFLSQLLNSNSNDH